MLLKFYKYHGAGNDFIIVDNRNKEFITSKKTIKTLCDRHFGIGADGLMTLENDTTNDFSMHYFNADGKEGTMCGNGGRCIVHFAKKIGVIEQNQTVFSAIDGVHKAEFISDDIVKLKMNNIDIQKIESTPEGFFLDTGSPHLVRFEDDIDSIDVLSKGRKLRYSKRFKKINGVNVNFVEISNGYLKMRTYERGVEAETLACGTGSVAVALVLAVNVKNVRIPIKINALGGNLKVYLDNKHDSFRNIWLEGPVKFVFSTQININ